ncbi:MAG: hypothetical protein IJU50_04950 [Lachnospiraceae bacterium]|nr:hypothetical protein [Lachnospiraceae bacterium]
MDPIRLLENEEKLRQEIRTQETRASRSDHAMAGPVHANSQIHAIRGMIGITEATGTHETGHDVSERFSVRLGEGNPFADETERLLECSERGGTLLEGSVFHRGDTRADGTIRAEGFRPAQYPRAKNDIESARMRAESILQWPVATFVMFWKTPALRLVSAGESSTASEQQRDSRGKKRLITKDMLDNDIKGGHTTGAGVATSAQGLGEMGGNIYRITLGESLSRIDGDSENKRGAIHFYGNGTGIRDSTVLAMHLVAGASGASEFVFLTPVPPGWIESIHQEQSS